MKGEQTSPTRWPLAYIKEVIPGKDGLVRVVTIQSPKGVYTHPVTKLVPLLSADEWEVTSWKAVRLLAGGMFVQQPGFWAQLPVFRLASQSKLSYDWKQLNKKGCFVVVVFRIRFATVSFHSIQFIHLFHICFVSFSIHPFIHSIPLCFISVQSNSTSFMVSISVHLLYVSFPGSTVHLPHNFVDYRVLVAPPFQSW